jgi:glycosyltransferase involved in cell wall biosynthesis
VKVALVHDYLREYGGAEMVLEDLHEIFPDAPVYTAYYNPQGLGIHAQEIQKWDIRTSWMQNIPFVARLLSPLRIIAPKAFASFDLSQFDVIISSCNLYSSKAVKTKKGSQLHLSYIHTPPKMLYGYTTSFNYRKHWWIKIGAEVVNHFLRIIDFEISQRPDILITNSKNVQQRIKKFYRRESVVVYPGVDILSFLPASPTQRGERKQESSTSKDMDPGPRSGMTSQKQYFLSLNRLMRGKGTEIVVAACTKLGLPLKVAGSGMELDNLKKIAGPTIEFVGHVTEDQKIELLKNAQALIVATEQEDFGITPIESLAAGTPVIAAQSGGYLETVTPGRTGEFFKVNPDLGQSKKYVDQESVENLIAVLEKFNFKKYNAEDCQTQAEKFSKENFRKKILELVDKHNH